MDRIERPQFGRNCVVISKIRLPSLPLDHIIPAECIATVVSCEGGRLYFRFDSQPFPLAGLRHAASSRAFDAHLTLTGRSHTRGSCFVLDRSCFFFLVFSCSSPARRSAQRQSEQPCAWAFFVRRPCAARNGVNYPTHIFCVVARREVMNTEAYFVGGLHR